MRVRLDPSTLLGWAAFGVPLGIYIASLQPGVAFWDTAEMQTVPYILGIPHPTGFPLFVLVGWAFSHAVPFGSVAWRLSLMSALAMALAARLVFSLVRLFDGEALSGFFAALLFALGEVAWTRGSRAEVHAFAVLFAALAMIYMVRFYRSGERRDFYVLALAVGLGAANHPVSALLLPCIILLVVRRRAALGRRDLLRAGAIVAACLSLYLYLPLRSAYVSAHRLDPTMALGVTAGRPFWDHNHPATLHGFLKEVTGSEFDVKEGIGGVIAVQRLPDVWSDYAHAAASEFGLYALAFAFAGAVMVVLEEPWVGGALVVMAAMPVAFVRSFHSESDVDRYFLTSYWLLAACAGVAASRLVRYTLRMRSHFGAVAAGAILAILCAAIYPGNRWIFDQRHDERAGRFAESVIGNTPRNAVVIAPWSYATSLAYAAYVERRFGQRIVLPGLPREWSAHYARWIRDGRPLYLVAGTDVLIPGFRMRPVVEGDTTAGDPFLFAVERVVREPRR